jgi:hypothetical protein
MVEIDESLDRNPRPKPTLRGVDRECLVGRGASPADCRPMLTPDWRMDLADAHHQAFGIHLVRAAATRAAGNSVVSNQGDLAEGAEAFGDVSPDGSEVEPHASGMEGWARLYTAAEGMVRAGWDYRVWPAPVVGAFCSGAALESRVGCGQLYSCWTAEPVADCGGCYCS